MCPGMARGTGLQGHDVLSEKVTGGLGENPARPCSLAVHASRATGASACSRSLSLAGMCRPGAVWIPVGSLP